MDQWRHPVEDLVEANDSLKSIRQWIERTIPCQPDTEDVRKTLRLMSFTDLLIRYLNWIDRHIPPRKRQPMVWDGFWLRNNPLAHSAELNTIIKLVAEGADISPFLSNKALTCGYVAGRSSARGIVWGDKDRALNAYGVHHLHLRPKNTNGRRRGDSRTLLYAAVSRKEFLLLILGDHNSFDDGSLYQAVSDHRAMSGWEIRGIDGVSPPHEASEAAKGIIHGVNSIGTSGDKFTVPSMIMSAGFSDDHVRHADKIAIVIEEWEPKLRSADAVRLAREQFGGWVPQDADWTWGLAYADLYLVEQRTGRQFCVVPWMR